MKLEKLTRLTPRRYRDACAAAHALGLVGERWALLVMREMMLGPRRFGELRASLPGLSANVLTQRLEGLEAAGLLRRRKLPPPASVQVYELTEWGREAEPIILMLGRWGARSPTQDPSMPLSAVSSMLSFRAMFDAERAGDADLSLRFRMGEDVFVVRIRDGEHSVARGDDGEVDVEIAGPPEAVTGMVYGFAELDELERQGVVTVTGDRAALLRFADIYELPPKACLEQAPE